MVPQERRRIGPTGRVVIRVSLEVCSRVTRFRTVISAASIARAVNLARARYPRGEARVLFPIDPELFFAATTATVPGTMRLNISEEAMRASERMTEAQQPIGRVEFARRIGTYASARLRLQGSLRQA
jgi:hypothetical protein